MIAASSQFLNSRQPSFLIMLDYDGVILDSKDLDARLFIRTLKAHCFYGINTVDEMLALCEGNVSERLTALGLSEEQVCKIYSEYADKMVHTNQKAQLFSGICEVLQELYKIAYVYIVTGNLSAVVEGALADNRVKSYDGILGADREMCKEQKIKILIGRHPGMKAFYVCDNRKDVGAARNAGAIPIAAEWGWHSVSCMAGAEPAFFLKNPQMLPYLLKRLYGIRPDNGSALRQRKEA